MFASRARRHRALLSRPKGRPSSGAFARGRCPCVQMTICGVCCTAGRPPIPAHPANGCRSTRLKVSPPRLSKLSLSIARPQANLAVPTRNRTRRLKPSNYVSRGPLSGITLSNAGEVAMRTPESTTAFGRLPASAGAQFHSEPALDVRRAVQSADTDKPFFEKRTEPDSAAPTEVSCGPFGLLPALRCIADRRRPFRLPA
jgi:hypothetical protein